MKHKKNGAALGISLCLCLLLLSGGCGKAEEKETLAENQTYIYAMVTSIQGNEISYTEIEESLITAVLGAEADTEMKKESKNEAENELENESGRAKDASVTGDAAWESPSSVHQMRGGGNMMSGGETVTTYIPVGTPVHTAADVVTTFSRLAAEDVLKMLVETEENGEQTILEIWMQI